MIKKIVDSLEHIPPEMLKQVLKNCVWEGTEDSDALALTFDDGPDPDVTPRILDVLDEIGGKGTFFLLGEKVKKHPNIARNIQEHGHAIGNHSFSHRKLLLMKREAVEYEIDETQKVISDAVGSEPVFFRPPYGLFDFTCANVVKERGMTVVLWTVLSGDYSGDSPEKIIERVLPFIKPGAIQVFHDTVAGGGLKLKEIIKKIGNVSTERNLRLAAIDELSIQKICS